MAFDSGDDAVCNWDGCHFLYEVSDDLVLSTNRVSSCFACSQRVGDAAAEFSDDGFVGYEGCLQRAGIGS
ncbi:hypothetical protein GCM10007874_36060 [Labrys miyagiensis]|uniref:Uncharacterized protein n=1 Tax=Labrys miyagiensis TaxID=346912 RepID=A0ABQ6CK66_9HYPH|nr:hypothetical protein GCM10007874_36060 [Labrys miyagiensis]